MVILSLDTTTRPGSVALTRDGALLECVVGDASRSYAERLPGEIAALLARHAVAPADVHAFGVAAGPGSFTGLRIGIATIQGLAFATGRPVVPVSALDALAIAGVDRSSDAGVAPPSGGGRPLVATWIDAHRHEVFTALYEAETPVVVQASAAGAGQGKEAGLALEGLVLIDAAAVGEPGAVLDRWAEALAGRVAWFVGDGALLYRGSIVTRPGIRATIVDPVPPLAPIIARVAARRVAAGDTTSPHGVRPVYVRRPDAELARDRRGLTASDSSGDKPTPENPAGIGSQDSGVGADGGCSPNPDRRFPNLADHGGIIRSGGHQ